MSLTLTVRKVHSTNTDKNLYFCLEKKAHSNQWISLFHIVFTVIPYSLFSKMGDKGERGVKNLKKWVMSFIDGPLFEIPYNHDNKPSSY